MRHPSLLMYLAEVLMQSLHHQQRISYGKWEMYPLVTATSTKLKIGIRKIWWLRCLYGMNDTDNVMPRHSSDSVRSSLAAAEHKKRAETFHLCAAQRWQACSQPETLWTGAGGTQPDIPPR